MIIFKLDELIWKNKTTAEAVHKATGIGTSTLSDIRNNKTTNISKNTINKICRHFNCSIEEFIVYIPD